MASKTFGKVFDKIKNLAGYSALSFSGSEEQVLTIKTLINDKIKIVNNLAKGYIYNVNKTTATVADQNNYAIPSGTDKINYISITVEDREYFLQYIPTIQFNTFRAVDSTSTSDIPTYYTIDQNQIFIYPTPATTGKVITINVNPLTADLTTTAGSTDQNTSIAVKEGWEEIIEYGVLADLFLQMENINQYNVYNGKYSSLMKDYKHEMKTPTTNLLTKFGPGVKPIDINAISEITNI